MSGNRVSYFWQTYLSSKLPSSLVVIFAVISNVFEGIGITLLIPIFHLLSEQSAGAAPDSSIFLKVFRNVYNFFGIELSVLSALIGFVFVVFLSNLFLFFQNVFIAHFNSKYEYELSCDLYKALFSARWLTLSKLIRGKLLNIFTKEINFARTVYYSFLMCLASLVKIGVFIAFSFIVSVKLTAAVLCVGVLVGVFVQALSKLARRLGDSAKESRSVLMEALVSVLDNLKFIKLMSLEQENSKSLISAANDYRLKGVYVACQGHLVTFVNLTIMAVLVSGVLYAGTAYFHMQLPQILALLLIYGRLSPVMNQFFGSYNWISSLMGSLEAVESLKKELNDNRESAAEGKKEVVMRTNISFEGVSFAYSDAYVLNDVNFTINKGEYVAITGETGSGKTTILDLLLLLLFPSQGDIKIDGVSTKNINLNSWRSQIGYVGPENYLVAKSIKENLLIANRDKAVEDKDIYQSLQQASLKKYVDDLDKGIHSVLLDRGQNMSTGQKQRLNLARAFLRDSYLLIMDEPTSALDSETEKMIRDEIKRFKGEKTIIVVTHKKDLAQDADRILEVRNGKVYEVKTECLVN